MSTGEILSTPNVTLQDYLHSNSVENKDIEEPESKRRGGWPSPIDPRKSRIVDYYKRILPENDMSLYLEFFTKPLPTTFRVSGAAKPNTFQLDYSKQFSKLFRKFAAGDAEGSPSEQVELQELPWIRGGWKFTADKRLIRLSEQYKRLHSFINLQHEAGFIVRQEAVSMVPPIFLQAQPSDSVLDVCAAPGSKTLQLLEDIGPMGMLVANDVDLKRCYVLVHNTITVAMPSLVITNCDASRFPPLPNQILFDKILADVPCSGDGTLRKSPDLWSRWTPYNGISLHPLQLRILLRSLQLLKVGGTIVYSTCSLNPIENEAVVAAALQICRGSLEVLDASDIAPSLLRSSGLTTWPVIDPATNEPLSSIKDVHATSRSNIYQTMFPFALFNTSANPDELYSRLKVSNLRACDKQICDVHGTTAFSEDIVSQLKRTMRFYPWLQDTGGFYVALLQLVKPLPGLEHSAIFTELAVSAIDFAKSQMDTATATGSSHPPRGLPPPMWQDLPMRPLQDKTIIDIVQQEYDLPDDFLVPYIPAQRQPEGVARVIMVSEKVAAMFLNNTDCDYQAIFRTVIAGCGCFQKQTGNEKFRASDGSHLWRIPQASAPFLLSKISFSKRILPPMPYSIFIALLASGLTSTETTKQTVLFDDLERIDSDYLQTVRAQSILGQCIISVDCSNPEHDVILMLNGLLFSGWVGAHSLGLHVQKRQRAALYEMLSAVNVNLGPSRAARQKIARKERRKNKEKANPESETN